MIPKIIHYVWFGPVSQIPKYQIKFIEEAHNVLEDYKFFLWTQQNFEKEFAISDGYEFLRNKKLYAFISDYVRLSVLLRYGGIYLDTDVKVLKDFGPLLNQKMFLGYIFDDLIGTAVIGSEPGNSILKDLLNKEDDSFKNAAILNTNLNTSNFIFTKYLIDTFNDFRLNGKEQLLKCGLHIYPRFYFEKTTSFIHKNIGGYSRHYNQGSWRTHNKIMDFSKKASRVILGKVITQDLYNLYAIRQQPFYERYKQDKKF